LWGIVFSSALSRLYAQYNDDGAARIHDLARFV